MTIVSTTFLMQLSREIVRYDISFVESTCPRFESPPLLRDSRLEGDDQFGPLPSLVLQFLFCSISRVVVWLRITACLGLGLSQPTAKTELI